MFKYFLRKINEMQHSLINKIMQKIEKYIVEIWIAEAIKRFLFYQCVKYFNLQFQSLFILRKIINTREYKLIFIYPIKVK